MFSVYHWQPTSIVSYNHLGNNDGMNLSAPQTFRSKEISKSNVVDDMVNSNAILYEPGEHPDHVVVIKVNVVSPIFLYFFLLSGLWFCLLCCCYCSMCLTLRTAREPWMSTLQRYSWVERTPLCCTIHARILSWLLLLYWTWSFLLSLALVSSSKLKRRSACIAKFNCLIVLVIVLFVAFLTSEFTVLWWFLQGKFHSFHPVATILSYLTKAPLVSLI